MSNYLLIESRDPYEAAGGALSYELAVDLARAGNKVAIFLVQNGVFAARSGAKSALLAHVANAGVEVLADEFSLRERGIAKTRVLPQVKPAPLEVVVDRLAAGCKTIWN
jgi:sulfur relay (sulfurtransferase) complex TusBCD TusD component (DsrE family)